MIERSKDATDEQFVDTVFWNMLSRAPDPDGRAAAIAMLSGGEDRLDVIDMILRSEEFRQLRESVGFARPGHFYSPHPARREIEAHRKFDWNRAALPAIDLREAGQLSHLEALAGHVAALPFERTPTSATRYGYENASYSYGDGVILFATIRHLRPKRIIEVGSGHSSCAILDTVERLDGAPVRVTFVEPYADLLRRLVRPGDLDRHRLLEHGLQRCPLDLFRELEAGDILFIDSSHVSKLGSDVNYLFFEILPALAPGVWVHVHDIFYPFEYPLVWLEEGRAWNEAYLLRAFLQFNQAWRIELFSSYMIGRHRQWFEARMPLVLRNWGGHIWLSRTQ